MSPDRWAGRRWHRRDGPPLRAVLLLALLVAGLVAAYCRPPAEVRVGQHQSGPPATGTGE